MPVLLYRITFRLAGAGDTVKEFRTLMFKFLALLRATHTNERGDRTQQITGCNSHEVQTPSFKQYSYLTQGLNL